MFTDLRVTYTPDVWNDALTIAVGFNNVLDEDPPILRTSTIGMSNVVHDLPGRVGYIRVSYQPN
jgi:iron complex outermembrane receptor protein